ncbi:MAG: hypothetical protein Q4P06_03930 [Actinomycetaceae bacterium]|nr:hypothetical protein [Actinomycetaceae bacterium]
MADIVFDETVAREFADHSNAVALEFSNQASARERCVNDAIYQFEGVYAKLFVGVCRQEAEDRRKLITKFRDLVEEIQHAVLVARQEKKRIKERKEWEMRESNRRACVPYNAQFGTSLEAIYSDPEPSDVALTPPTISCSTTIARRIRHVSTYSPNGKSSAHPDRLDDFCRMRLSLDYEIEQKKRRLERSLQSFRSACSWARLDSSTIIDDLNAHLIENEIDTIWVARIAQAFREANQFSLHSCSGYVDDVILGGAAGVLKYVRGIYVPVSAHTIPVEALKPRTLNSAKSREIFFGQKLYHDPKTKLYLPDRLDSYPQPADALTSSENIKTKAFLVNSTEIGADVRWAKMGGKALGVIGAGFTVWSNYSEEYNEEALAHPELSDPEIQLRAVGQTALVSTVEISASAIGGIGGAKLGSVIGGTIGSVVPGPGTAIGAAVGGIFGAVVGGIAGGFLGQRAVTGLADGSFGR